jgi:hypothetical protein
MYNLSFLDNVTTATQLVGGVDALAGGWFMGFFLIGAFVIGFMVFYGRVGVGEILAGEGLIFSIIAILMEGADLLAAWVIGIPVAVTVIGILIILMQE